MTSRSQLAQGATLPEMDSWKLKALILSITLAMAGYLLVSLWGGWRDVSLAFVQIGIVGTIAALTMSLVNYGLRFLRWQCYLDALGHSVPWRPGLRIYLSGFALTTTPGKAGEAFRAVLLLRHGVPASRTIAAFISERLSDLVAILLLSLLGLAQFPQAQAPVFLAVVLLLLVFVGISHRGSLTWLVRQGQGGVGRLRRLLAQIGQTLLSARRCHSPRLLALATLLSVLAWGAEALAFYWVLGWLGADVTLSFAVFVYAVSMLAGALSFLPGGLGSAEAAMLSLLLLAGMGMPDAIAATVFIRLATLWFAVVLGLFALNAGDGVALVRNDGVITDRKIDRSRDETPGN